MGGGLMQLVAYGAQDVYLTGNPQITFWKVTYRRHTNFAMESIEQTFNGQADFGRRVQCTVSRNGDLAYRTYLQVVLPQINACIPYTAQGSAQDATFARWIDNPGINMIDYVEVEIGGQRIDRQYGQFMHLWNQLTMTAEQERGYNKMVGQTTQLTYLTDPSFSTVNIPCNTGAPCNTCVPRCSLPETTLYVPLQFWFCRNPGLALPLIALQYHEVKINVELRGLDCLLWAVDALNGAGTNGTSNKTTQGAYTKSLVAASLYVDYVFLDTDERRRMAQNPHEYLIEQLQFTGAESVGSSSNKIKLNFNHPCKELIFTVQKDYFVDCCKQYETGEQLYKALGVQPFNYTDCIDALPNAYHAFAGPMTAGSGEFVVSGLFVDPGAMTISADFHQDRDKLGNPAVNFTGGGEHNSVLAWGGSYVDGWYPTSGAPLGQGTGDESLVSDAGAFVLAETALDMHCWGENPVVTAKLQLNGQDRFSEREGPYFDTVQPYQHHTRSPDTGINVYSFALRPEEHQPSGTCNMSRIDNATLQLVLSNNTIGGEDTAKVAVYATNYNVLRVMSGMGGLAYSN
jgi:hypothetical protein